ncbi:MAG: helix-turn-helix domain-containing protein [Polyangiaceae bacterium]
MHPDVRRLLNEYGWPGNVRELENTLERAMVLTDGDVLLTSDLPERIHQARDPIRLHLRSDELSIKKTSRIVEEELIRRALQKTGGNRTHAAKFLEISHRALLYKIKDYEIEL